MSVEIPIRVFLDNCEESQQQYILVGSENSEQYSASASEAIIASYGALRDKPTINGVVVEGDKVSKDYHIDQTYVHTQASASKMWTINHNLGKRPSVTVVDSAGSVVVGDVRYISDDICVCTFSAPFSGQAYLN